MRTRGIVMGTAIALSAVLFGCAVDAQTIRTVWDGVYTSEQAARGKFDYMDSCASCHGKDLSGGNAAMDPPPPPLKQENFGVGWRDLGRMYEFLRDQMPRNAAGSLPRAAYVDIVAYLLQQNSYPAGEVELSADIEALARILVVKKPDTVLRVGSVRLTCNR
jgi:cytochrome c